MESIIQTLLASSEYQDINAWVSIFSLSLTDIAEQHTYQREFTLQLLPLLSRKLKHTIPSLLPHPPLLAHTIYQALTFDAALSEEGFQLIGTSATRTDKEDKWEGVSEVILGNLEWFEVWLLGEKRCTISLRWSLLVAHNIHSQLQRINTTKLSVHLMLGLLLTRMETIKVYMAVT
jgi:hypothetical protein